MRHKDKFLSEVFNRFEFRVFIFIGQLPYPSKENSLPYYFLIVDVCVCGRIAGFILFSRVLALCVKYETPPSRIWTRVAVSISFDNNRYTRSAYAIWLIRTVYEVKSNVWEVDLSKFD